MVSFISFEFRNPTFLWFLLSIPVLILTHFFTLKYTKMRAFKFANFEALQKIASKAIISAPYGGGMRNRQLGLLGLRLVTLLCIIFAVSGTILWYTGPASSMDYVLAIDASSSMLAKDFSPDRFTAAKDAAKSFIDSTPANTQIGIVSFAGTSVVQKRLTSNKNELKTAIDAMEISQTGGTAVGDAIITSSNLFVNKDIEKGIVLITDGQSNVGMFVEEGAAYAVRDNIAVYTIGVATPEGGIYGNLSEIVLKLDEDTLKFIANATAAGYYKAEDANQLKTAYQTISNITDKKLFTDLTIFLMLGALVMLFIEWSLVNVKYKTIP